jgi:hypothetical protein
VDMAWVEWRGRYEGIDVDERELESVEQGRVAVGSRIVRFAGWMGRCWDVSHERAGRRPRKIKE